MRVYITYEIDRFINLQIDINWCILYTCSKNIVDLVAWFKNLNKKSKKSLSGCFDDNESITILIYKFKKKKLSESLAITSIETI